MASDNGKSFLDKFAEVSAKVGNQVQVDFQSQRNSLNGPRVSAASATRK